MKITFKNITLVKPAVATPYNKDFHLSILDQTGCIMHIPTIYFYRMDDPERINTDAIMNELKASLSKLLVRFYPLAGRLHYVESGGGRMALECNDKGVEMIEAKCDAKLEQLGEDFVPSQEFYELFPSIDYKGSSIEELPLLYVQLTEFRCGGIALSLTMSHAVADGQSAIHFVYEWARIAHGGQIGVEPIHDRRVVTVSKKDQSRFMHKEFESPPLLIGEKSNENEWRKATTIVLLKLNEQQVEKLKNKANADNHQLIRPYSRYEVIAAHVWKTACSARRLCKLQQTRISFCIDIRNHLDPPLPKGYFGNAIIDVCSLASSGELLSNSLCFSANKIRETILEVKTDYVNSALNFLDNQKDLSKFQDLHAYKNDKGPFYGNPNLQVISWLSLPFHDLDLGWGKEICMRPGTLDSDGDCVLLPSDEKDGSVVVSICLQEEHMDDFKNLFYQF